MTKTLLSIASWAALGWLFASWISPNAGWSVFSAGLVAMILLSGFQLSQISKWVVDLTRPPPASVGPWDNILAPIYRQLRKNSQDLNYLRRQVDSILLAAAALPDGTVTLDNEMAVVWCNQTAGDHIGLNPDADYKRSIFNILRAPEFAKYARQASWSGPILLHTNKDGRSLALTIQIIPYGVDQYLLVTRDVTQFEKIETTRKDFVANVSHELRTPLTVLSGFLETLHDMPADSFTTEQKQRYQTLMLEQAHRMQAIVEDLLTLSSLESSPTAESESVQMGAIIHTALQQAKALSSNKHVFIENIDEDLHVAGNASELSSAVSNLLTNAIRYTPNDGIITVSWYRTKGGQACFSVQDTGIGIAAQDISRLTERFYRVDRGRSRATGGTGLGLAITKHIALRHHAELSIRSRLGAGSLFSLEFPAQRISRRA